MAISAERGADAKEGGCHADTVLSVLVVDDVEDNRLLLKMMLERVGYRVILAGNGLEAVAVFQAQAPDIVLLDVMMPVMDGYEAAGHIKSCAEPRFVPILFVTALTDERDLAKCVEAGGDDFIVKPISRTLLKAKLLAAERLLGVYREYVRQQQELQAHHDRLRNDHEVAEHLFARIMNNTAFEAANIRYDLAPMAIANGDLILMARTPVGDQLVLLGDFAGHGLSAAIGAIPVTDIFRTMAAKGLAIELIAAELNRKLHRNLPTGQFLAACLLDWSPRGGRVRIWNGGVPDVLIVAEAGEVVFRAPSRHLPLGVVGDEEFEVHVETRAVCRGDRIIAYSDGLIEARNNRDEMFGQRRLEGLIACYGARGRLFEELQDAVRHFRGGEPQNDDVTLIEILCDEGVLEDRAEEGAPMSPPAVHIAHWKMNLKLGPAALAGFDPLTAVVFLVNCLPSLKSHQSSLYVIVVELYMNALDHGVLKMDVALKRDQEGFAHYYAERERRLSALGEGWIGLDTECFPRENGGRVVVRIEDSGAGFDAGALSSPVAVGSRSYGRGLGLVRALCESVDYNERGNRVTAVYEWLNKQ